MTQITEQQIDTWADDLHGPVALHFRQQLVPVEHIEGGPGEAVIFPPTYARKKNETGSPYNIDLLSDGTKTALIDSVGSQANRLEPIFTQPRLAELVPQWWIQIPEKDKRKPNELKRINLLTVGHRLGDAFVRSTELGEKADAAFRRFMRLGDAAEIAKLGPTSLVFGVWDSRETQAKFPRLISSVVRAWDVDELRRSAQYFPPINYADQGIITKEARSKAEENPKSETAKRGMVAVPAVNTHGGIVVRGGITRNVTVNLIALRQLTGADDVEGLVLRRYLLGLTLLAANEPLDGFLRQGCLLVPHDGETTTWHCIQRSGERQAISLPTDLPAYATARAQEFGVGRGGDVTFDPKLAKQHLTSKNRTEEQETEEPDTDS